MNLFLFLTKNTFTFSSFLLDSGSILGRDYTTSAGFFSILTAGLMGTVVFRAICHTKLMEKNT